MRGREQVMSEQERATTLYEVFVRNVGFGASLDETMRVVWRGQTMNIRTAPTAGRDQYRMFRMESDVNT